MTSKGGKAALSEIAHVMRVLYALAIMVANPKPMHPRVGGGYGACT